MLSGHACLSSSVSLPIFSSSGPSIELISDIQKSLRSWNTLISRILLRNSQSQHVLCQDVTQVQSLHPMISSPHHLIKHELTYIDGLFCHQEINQTYISSCNFDQVLSQCDTPERTITRLGLASESHSSPSQGAPDIYCGYTSLWIAPHSASIWVGVGRFPWTVTCHLLCGTDPN